MGGGATGRRHPLAQTRHGAESRSATPSRRGPGYAAVTNGWATAYPGTRGGPAENPGGPLFAASERVRRVSVRRRPL